MAATSRSVVEAHASTFPGSDESHPTPSALPLSWHYRFRKTCSSLGSSSQVPRQWLRLRSTSDFAYIISALHVNPTLAGGFSGLVSAGSCCLRTVNLVLRNFRLHSQPTFRNPLSNFRLYSSPGYLLVKGCFVRVCKPAERRLLPMIRADWMFA